MKPIAVSAPAAHALLRRLCCAALRRNTCAAVCHRAAEPPDGRGGQGRAAHQQIFVDACLPRSERAELSDYKGSGYARSRQPAQHSVAIRSRSVRPPWCRRSSGKTRASGRKSSRTRATMQRVRRAMCLSSPGQCLVRAAARLSDNGVHVPSAQAWPAGHCGPGAA